MSTTLISALIIGALVFLLAAVVVLVAIATASDTHREEDDK